MVISRLALLGMQWGDEGKGKLIDVLAERADFVVRYQGGHNAGHTVIFYEDEQDANIGGPTNIPRKMVLHLLPCGVAHKNAHCVIANGVILSLPALQEEIRKIHGVGYDILPRLSISRDCSLVLPSHIALDKMAEAKLSKSNKSIGTTCRGIGPAYEDHYARRAIKLKDVAAPNFDERLKSLLDYHNFLLRNYYGGGDSCSFDYKEVGDEMRDIYQKIKPTIKDTVALLQSAVENNKKIIWEGAQGCGLDVNHGTYPFVTSSATCIGGLFTGSGVSHKSVEQVVGIVKAYATRVGEGPFATELNDADGKMLQEKGNEFGSTTGRPRRCGWLDLEYLKRSVQLNGVDGIFLTKADVLDGFTNIKLRMGERMGGKQEHSQNKHGATSEQNLDDEEYESMPGWQQDISKIREYEELPAALKNFVCRIECEIGVPVWGVSVGAQRSQLIVRQDKCPQLKGWLFV